MKIHFIIDTLKGGGAERVLLLVADYLSDRKYDVSIITFMEGEDYEVPDHIKRIHLHGGKIKPYKLRNLLNLRKYYSKKEHRPDIAISFLPPASFVALLVAKLYKITIVCSEHINHLRSRDFTANFARNYLYRSAQKVTILTAFDEPYYKKRGVDIIVMPNPCTFKPLTDPNRPREKVILAIGSLDRYYHKGFDNLVEIMAPFLKKNKDWTLKIVGSGDEGRGYLEELILKNQINEQIILTGYRSDVNKLMQESDIFILPSRFEGLPMVLIEAMSQGMACISYDCKTGPSDMIIDGHNGLLIEDQNKEAMIKGLENLVANPAIRNEIRKNAVKAVDKYSLANIGGKWEDLLNSISPL